MKFRLINAGHLATHGVTRQQYQEKFPTASLCSKKLSIRRRETIKRLNADPDFREAQRKSVVAKNKRDNHKLWADQEFREKHSAAASKTITRLNSNPEFRKKQVASLRRPETRRKQSKQAKRVWKNSLERRQIHRDRLIALWEDPSFRQKQGEATSQRVLTKATRRRLSRALSKRWADPSYRELMQPNAKKWTRPEKTVRKWLKDMGLYRTGGSDTVGFLPHAWLPTKGFTANADFADYRHCLIVHVDGSYWHGIEEVSERDARLDQWCKHNGWSFIRLGDKDIARRPKACRNKIRRLVREVAR